MFSEGRLPSGRDGRARPAAADLGGDGAGRRRLLRRCRLGLPGTSEGVIRRLD